ncbi:MAG: D-alanyl-D-alanine carboxypeptidase [Chlorobiaceae bacterium]|nr:D-alanyl-D-alanine carboxypeptidase [Chlorobiaceae bacterium]
MMVAAPDFLIPSSLHAESLDPAQQFQVPIASYILKDRVTSRVLMEKDVDKPVSPASLTKTLTSIMAIESGRLDDDVVIPEAATLVEPSKAGFKPGEKVKLYDLVKAAMVSSSNDAAFAIAIHLAGNVDNFVAVMNRKARMIGMNNSRFTNPAGFDKGIYAGNYSTASDLMKLTEYAIKNPFFNSVAKQEYAVFTEQTTQKQYALRTHNRLLEKYPYTVGIKTGFTARAGKCLIARAIKDNRDILLVMLNARTDRWGVAEEMFDNAFTGGPMNPALFASLNRFDSVSTRPEAEFSEVRAVRHAAPVSRLKMRKNSRVISIRGLHISSRENPGPGKISRHAGKRPIALSKNTRNAKHPVLAVRKTVKKQRHNTVALNKAGKRPKSET